MSVKLVKEKRLNGARKKKNTKTYISTQSTVAIVADKLNLSFQEKLKTCKQKKLLSLEL